MGKLSTVALRPMVQLCVRLSSSVTYVLWLNGAMMSRDHLIPHMPFPIGGPLNQASLSNGFRDSCELTCLCLCSCVSVRLPATLMLNISETKWGVHVYKGAYRKVPTSSRLVTSSIRHVTVTSYSWRHNLQFKVVAVAFANYDPDQLSCSVPLHITFLADRTNSGAYELQCCVRRRPWRYVLWLNGAS